MNQRQKKRFVDPSKKVPQTQKKCQRDLSHGMAFAYGWLQERDDDVLSVRGMNVALGV